MKLKWRENRAQIYTVLLIICTTECNVSKIRKRKEIKRGEIGEGRLKKDLGNGWPSPAEEEGHKERWAQRSAGKVESARTKRMKICASGQQGEGDEDKGPG